jgi:hypothetical protein
VSCSALIVCKSATGSAGTARVAGIVAAGLTVGPPLRRLRCLNGESVARGAIVEESSDEGVGPCGFVAGAEFKFH